MQDNDNKKSVTLRMAHCCIAIAILVVALGARNNCHGETRDTNPQRLVQKIGLEQNLNVEIPLSLRFRDETGQDVALSQYFTTKPVVLALVYYRCPMLCTQVLNGLLESTQAIPLELNRDFELVTISIDPRETPEMASAKKQQYVGRYFRPGGKEGWHFLTGDSQSIEELASVVGYRYAFDPKSNQYAHASGIIILTPKGKTSRYLYGIDYVPDELSAALNDASQQRIGSPMAQFLLLCFHYDPATGRYGFLIANLFRVVGIGMLIGFGWYLRRMYRRERQLAAMTISRPRQPSLSRETEGHYSSSPGDDGDELL